MQLRRKNKNINISLKLILTDNNQILGIDLLSFIVISNK